MPKTIFSDENMVVVEVVKAARIAAGLKQTDLAERIEKDQSWVSLVEGSQRRLDVVEFIKLAQALDIRPSTMLDEIVEKIAQSER
ncbi:helix-turn-helix domain-containing protein [Sphingomonas faeni]|uniref:helix-turn-helix domain-containing protein n=1 Tax=Sphingomonas faeni TaxID=185950 RepID=UPI0020C7CA6A|nr:helix-turn-helix transcriptional regulator [Sphingomonas faeni]MCP8892825.1 helix-turn-helix domain-containing protein [Sphingomonas faeni]